MSVPLVSVIVIGYKRPEHLRETVVSLLETTSYPNLKLIYSDDGRPSSMIDEVTRTLPFDTVLTAPGNQGLGANTNKGIRAARGEYILQLQDDFRCLGPHDFIQHGVNALKQFPDVDIVRYRLGIKYPNVDRRVIASSNKELHVIDRKQPTEGATFYQYSDHPHLKARDFHLNLGFYIEHKRMNKVEADFCRRFLAQERCHCSYIVEYENIFEHTGSDNSFRTTSTRFRLWSLYQRIKRMLKA